MGDVKKFDVFPIQPTWDNLKQKTTKKVQASSKTGSGGSTLTELDNVILDCINAESSYLTGLGQEDDAPAFGTHSEVFFRSLFVQALHLLI